jgi:pimeloyl-ACP methyl ester carboxylesterase
VFEMAGSPSTEEVAGRRASSAVTQEGTARHETGREPRRTRSNQPPPSQQPKERLGRIVAGSLASGLFAAGVLAAMPFIPAEPSELTGAVLCGFGLGWAMLGVLSVRFTDQPQRWAWAPAAVMGLGGLSLIAFGQGAHDALSWVWPPVTFALTVWMVARIRRDVGSRFGRWLLYPVLVLLAVVSAAAGTETVLSRTAPDYAMPGQLVDVGGHRLHLHCTGSGSPTVVLEPGAGMSSSTMGWIAPAVARDTRVCVYDRAGRGWSDPTDTTQDATQIATDLHTLLRRAEVPGPYVLAGHSFGGLYVLSYAALYPTEVAGMALIDSTSPVSAPTPPTSAASSYDPKSRISALLSSTARFGLMRFVVGLSGDTLPPASAHAERASLATSEHLRSTINEYLQGGTSAKEASSLATFDDKPLLVLTAGEGSSAGWMPKQDKLAALSTNSAHRIIEGAAHADLAVDEHAAAATSRAIRDVVAAVRTGMPLEK